MEEGGLAAIAAGGSAPSMMYGNGTGNTVTHAYGGALIGKQTKKKTKKKGK